MKQDQKGFTLGELLIVVMIVSCLVAISIPMFLNKKKKAMAAVDASNVRAAKSLALSEYMLEEKSDQTYYYDANNGVMKDDDQGITSYGMSSVDLPKGEINIDDHAIGIPEDGIVKVEIDDFDMSAQWINNEKDSNGTNDVINNFVTTNWDEIKKKGQYGVDIPHGTIITDGDSVVVVFAYTNNYKPEDMSLIEFANKYNDRVIVWDKDTNIVKIEGKHGYLGKHYDKGTMVCYENEYYIANRDMKYDSQENNNFNSDSRWAKLTQKQQKQLEHV